MIFSSRVSECLYEPSRAKWKMQDTRFGDNRDLTDDDDPRFGNRVMVAVPLKIEAGAKTRRNVDIFFDNHTPQLCAFTDANARHQNGFVNSCPLFKLYSCR